MAGARAPLHLGGPLGALGLGCVGGAVALAIAAINNEPMQGETPPPNVLKVETESLPAQRSVESAERVGTGLGGAPPEGPLESGGGGELAQAQGVPALPIQRPARAEGTEVHFIVRLKGAPEIDVITRNFKRDPGAATTAWNDLSTRLPGLADFTLAGASYSGEIKLAYRMPNGTAASPEEIEVVRDRLLKIEGVSYADPDYVAHPGKEKTP